MNTYRTNKRFPMKYSNHYRIIQSVNEANFLDLQNHMTTASQIVKRLEATSTGGLDTEILDITHDSRQAKPNSLFVAIQGLTVDGHRFVDDVMRRGAAGIVSRSRCRSGGDPRIRQRFRRHEDASQLCRPREGHGPKLPRHLGRERLVGGGGSPDRHRSSLLLFRK